jgi:hypothetical protein
MFVSENAWNKIVIFMAVFSLDHGNFLDLIIPKELLLSSVFELWPLVGQHSPSSLFSASGCNSVNVGVKDVSGPITHHPSLSLCS